MSHARMVTLPCWPFEFTPSNKLHSENLVRSITLVPFIYQVKMLTFARMVASPCCPFLVICLESSLDLKASALVNSNPLKYFDDIWYTYLSGQDGVSRAITVALPCWRFELSPLYELYIWKVCALSNSYTL